MKRVQSRFEVQVARLTHAADAAGAFIGTGSKDTAEWLGKETGTSTGKNRKSAQLGEAMSKSDELTDAVTSGDVSTDQAAAAVGAAGGETLDAEIVDTIADLPLPDVKPAVENWRNRKDPDGEADLAEHQRGRRRLTIRATWCDAHHIVHRSDDGPTNDEHLVLLCHRHHQLSHRKGWTMTGTGGEIVVTNADGSVERTRPPGVSPPRAGETGREPPDDGAPPGEPPAPEPSWLAGPEQLTLA